MRTLPRSSNAVSTNDHFFEDPYFLCRHAMHPKIDGFNMFMYFYQNKIENVPLCNLWNRNMEKLIFLKVFVDMYLLNALISSYNPSTRSFHRYNGSILCRLDMTSFIEAFGLEGKMDVPIDIEDL